MYLIINQVIKIVDSTKIFRNLGPILQTFGAISHLFENYLFATKKTNKNTHARIC